jgi:hypothetical protein
MQQATWQRNTDGKLVTIEEESKHYYWLKYSDGTFKLADRERFNLTHRPVIIDTDKPASQKEA